MEKTSSSLMKNSINIKEINSSNNKLSEADFLSLFSWPPRSYTCTFCKREFRSAQALGGHMNVHRRDRARLRQTPPHLNLNLDTNPSFVCFSSCNPSFSPISSLSSSSSAAAKKVHQSPMIPPSVSTISTTPPVTVSDHLMRWGRADFAQDLMARRFFELEKLGSIMHENGGNLGMENSVKLELISEIKEDHHVDLELRLGYV